MFGRSTPCPHNVVPTSPFLPSRLSRSTLNLFLLNSPHAKLKILHPPSRTPTPPLRTPPRNRHAPGALLRRRTIQSPLRRRFNRHHSKRRPANLLHPPG